MYSRGASKRALLVRSRHMRSASVLASVFSIGVFHSISVTMSAASRAAFVAAPMSRRILCRNSSASSWGRALFSSSPSQIQHTEDDNRDICLSLTRTEIRRLKVAPLREELAKRGLDATGTRPALISRLIDTIDEGAGPSADGAANQKATKDRTRIRRTDAGRHDALDPERTYVLRVTAHSNTPYNASGAGLVLYDARDVREVWVARKYFPERQTMFEAAYQGAILGLRYARQQGATKIVLQTDNDVILQQIRGQYNVKKDVLRDLCYTATQLLETFSDYQLTPITPAENTRAKNLARRAIATKKSIGLPANDADEQPIKTEKQLGIGHRRLGELSPPADEIPAKEDEEVEEQGASALFSPDKTYLLRFDGGSRGNPGIAGSGMVLYDMDDMRELWCGWKYLGDGHTNNEAEYNGLLIGMQCAMSLGVRKLQAEGDSQLVVKHLTGAYRVKDPKMKKLFTACKGIIDTFDDFKVEFIPRDENGRADQLANQAMDTRESFGFEEKTG